MADLFGSLGGGLGGLMKGLSGFMPQDDPGTQKMKMQGEASDLKNQENDLYIRIGKKAVHTYGLEAFAEEGEQLKLVQANIKRLEQLMEEARRQEEEKKREKEAAMADRTCSECGHVNPVGTKFCQECGNKLGQKNICPSCGTQNPLKIKFCQECGTSLVKETKKVCTRCGHENAPDIRFCGGCGAKLEEPELQTTPGVQMNPPMPDRETIHGNGGE